MEKYLLAELEAAKARCADLVDKCDELRARVGHLELPDCNHCGGVGSFDDGIVGYSCNRCGGTGKQRP